MLFNFTTGKVLCAKTRLAKSALQTFKGLMFESEKNFDYALVFYLPRESALSASVHMMFVFFPIDIVFLDLQRKVVDKARLHPWELNYTPKKAAKYFVEMPQGMSKDISIGDVLEWRDK